MAFTGLALALAVTGMAWDAVAASEVPCHFTATNLVLVTKEVSLGKIPLLADRAKWALSRDRRHVAYPVRRGLRVCMAVDGVEGKEWFSAVGPPHWPPRGARPAFAARREAEWSVVVDGVSVPVGELVGEGQKLDFSPDGKHWACVTRQDGRSRVVVDGRAGPVLDAAAWPVFSDDGARSAYPAQEGDWVFIMLDGLGQRRHPRQPGANKGLTGGFFSPDGRHFAYGVRESGKEWYVVDGKDEAAFDALLEDSFRFSPDSRHYAYAGKRGGAVVVMFDGRELRRHPFLGSGSLMFSPVEGRLAYVTGSSEEGDQMRVNLDGQDLGSQGDIMHGSLLFSPDGRRHAVVVAQPGTRGSQDRRYRMVVDGEPGPVYDGVGRDTGRFSADGRHYAYVASRNGLQFVVLDGIEGKPYDGITEGSLHFSPDGGYLVYSAMRPGESFIVVGGTEGKRYPLPAGEEYTRGRLEPVFDGPRAFHYVVLQDDDSMDQEFVVVEVEIRDADGQGNGKTP